MRYSRPSGFTFVEFMVAVGISTIVFGVGLYMISMTQRAQAITTNNLRIAENARLFFEMVEKDLAGAYPVAFQNFGANTRAELVKIQTPSGAVPESDCLQFFSKPDHTASPDSVTYVRYFVSRNVRNPERTVLCRELLFGYLIEGSNTFLPPPAIDPANANNTALFDGVRSVQFCYRQWLPEKKSFDLELTNPQFGNPAKATHLLVRLFMYENVTDPKKVDPKAPPTKEALKVKPLPRMFQKAIPIPNSFLRQS